MMSFKSKKSVRPGDLKVLWHTEGMRRSTYMELLPRPFSMSWWNPGSCYVSFYSFELFESTVTAFAPDYDPYSETELNVQQVEQIVARLRAGRRLLVLKLPGVMEHYGLLQEEWDFLRVAGGAELAGFMEVFCQALETQVAKNGVVWILGM